MRNIVLVAILSWLLFSCGGEKQVEQVSASPEEMGEVLFNAIKTGDAATIRAYIATEADVDERLNKSSLSDKKKDKKKKKLLKKVAKVNDGLAKTLEKIKGEDIAWEATSYDWVDYKNFDKDSVNGADIYIVFSKDRTQYEIKLKECYPTARGWVLFDEITYKGLRK
ncbi:MAG: hypothetical protein N4A35_01955 [Flavobacteriales bacterium]|jgi:hypothetical protein|nr:hypothetical protein [Flavobacteriales bacterium]